MIQLLFTSYAVIGIKLNNIEIQTFRKNNIELPAPFLQSCRNKEPFINYRIIKLER